MLSEPIGYPLRLLRARPHLDIVVGDYGRDAAIRYMHLASQLERAQISDRLTGGDAFFDEYRRIVYAAHLEVVEHKANELAKYASTSRPLDSGILIGLGGRGVSAGIRRGILKTIVRAIDASIDRPFARVRVVLPCNTLSGLLNEFRVAATDQIALEDLLAEANSTNPALEMALRSVVFCPLVDTVAREVVHLIGGRTRRVLVLGTAEANDLYSSAFREFDVSVVPLTNDQIQLIDDSVMACIAGDTPTLDRYRSRLQTEVVSPAERRYGEVYVLEACTDFEFSIGVDALSIFAQTMVERCYESYS